MNAPEIATFLHVFEQLAESSHVERGALEDALKSNNAVAADDLVRRTLEVIGDQDKRITDAIKWLKSQAPTQAD